MTSTTELVLPEDQRHTDQRHKQAPKKSEPYVADDRLITAANLAMYLRRPLLLEGEAGCGKSRLAHHVADQLGLPLYCWYVRSTSKVQDGLYTYDSILRLHDVHLQKTTVAAGGKTKKKVRDPGNPTDYRELGPLGKAFSERACPAVVLIDEIDKAEIDFPNDLLTVLDDPWSFDIPETYETICADKACHPIVIITSNKEKGNLPSPFLRRCVYYYLEFPDAPEQLKSIVLAHRESRQHAAPGGKPIETLDTNLIDAASERFLDLRAGSELFKKPGTSEYLDWLDALHAFGQAPYAPDKLKKAGGPLPYPELLFKLRADWRRYVSAP